MKFLNQRELKNIFFSRKNLNSKIIASKDKIFYFLIIFSFFLFSSFNTSQKVSGKKVLFLNSDQNCVWNDEKKEFLTCKNFNKTNKFKFEEANKNLIKMRSKISVELNFEEEKILTETWSGTSKEILKSLGFETFEFLKTEPALDELINSDTKIKIFDLKKISINGKYFLVSRQTLGESLIEAGFSTSEISTSTISPNLNSKIYDGMLVFMHKTSFDEEIEKEEIPFEEKTIYDPEISEGTEKILSEGRNGLRVKTYKITRENGQIISKDLISNKIEIEKIDKKILIGTRRTGNEKTNEISYIGKATWYGWTGPDKTWEYQDYNKNLPPEFFGFGCASRDFPKGTKLKVTNLANSKNMICIVNDYIENKERIIDLSKTGFATLANPSLGIINVRVEKA
ncbi:MAG: hypothetical protein Fur0024_2950 [Patescibacteria group bacterium]